MSQETLSWDSLKQQELMELSSPGKQKFIFGMAESKGLPCDRCIHNLCVSGVDASFMLLGLRGPGW